MVELHSLVFYHDALLIRWIKRYGPSEFFGTLGVYVGFFAAEHFSHIQWIAAYAGSMGENLGFYGILLFQRIRTKESFWASLIEFGPAELLDSFLMRPLALYLGVELLGPVWGLLVGKIVSDLLFYIPVIATHEFMRRSRFK